MLNRRTKYLLKLMRGWSSADVARYYNVAESTVSKQTYHLPPTPILTKQPSPLFSSKHYSELTIEDVEHELSHRGRIKEVHLAIM